VIAERCRFIDGTREADLARNSRFVISLFAVLGPFAAVSVYLSPARGQDAKNVERPAAELYRLVAAAQFAPGAIEPEPAEADLPLGHRMVPSQDN
jgi:hypothetical protein